MIFENRLEGPEDMDSDEISTLRPAGEGDTVGERVSRPLLLESGAGGVGSSARSSGENLLLLLGKGVRLEVAVERGEVGVERKGSVGSCLIFCGVCGGDRMLGKVFC